MRNILISVLAIITGILFLGSCAQFTDTSIDELQDRSLAAWINLNDPTAQLQANGMYVKKLVTVTDHGARTPVQGNWIKVNYTIKTLKGDIIVSRDSNIARQMGSFSRFTHYVPEYVPFYLYGGYYLEITSGMYEGLSQMKEGEQWRLYLPSRLGYGQYSKRFEAGFQGVDLSADTPIMIDIELVQVIPYPTAHELDEVMAYAMTNWNKKAADTLLTGMYVNHRDFSVDTATVRFNKNVFVYYVGRFLDGFVFDTNIADTARKYNIYESSSTKYTALEMDLTTFIDQGPDADTTFIRGFFETIASMRFGETASSVFISDYGYGYEGYPYSSINPTIIQSYTPLQFDVITVTLGGEGKEDVPYSIHGILNFTGTSDDTWGQGYIVGVVEGNNILTDGRLEGTFTTKTNLLLADKSDEKLLSNMIAVELPAGSTIGNALNLVDNPTLKGKRIKFNSELTEFLGANGLTSVKSYKFVN